MSFEEVRDLENRVCQGQAPAAGCSRPTRCRPPGEVLGLMLPGGASIPAVEGRKFQEAYRAGERVIELLRQGIRPRDILTREAFENAIAVVVAMGGSTNAVLHLTAIAREDGVPLEIDDFERLSRRVPVIGDMQPGGRYTMPDLDEAGGVPIVVKLAEAGLFDTQPGHRRGRTWADHLDPLPRNGGPGRHIADVRATLPGGRPGDLRGTAAATAPW